MKVLMLRNPAASYGCPLTEGQAGDIDAELAKTLIDIGIAVPASVNAVPPASVKAVPAEPQISGDETAKQPKGSKASNA